jgi:hypothetical protein
MSLFEVRNAANRLQFSTEQAPMTLLQKVTLTLNSGTVRRIGGGSGSNAISSYGSNTPVPAGTQIMASYCEINHTIDYRVGNTVYISHQYNSPNAVIELYCFGYGVPTTVSGGFEMRDAANNIIFNANTCVFRPVAYVVFAEPEGNEGYGTLLESYTGPTGRKLAFVPQNEGAYLERDYQPNPNVNSDAPQYQVQTNMYACAIANYNNSVNFNHFLMNKLKTLPANSDESGPPEVNSRGSGLIIDVTGY